MRLTTLSYTLAILVCAGQAWGQPQSPERELAPSPAVAPDVAKSAEAVARAKAVLERARLVYAGLSSYQDHTTAQTLVQGENGEKPEQAPTESTVRFKSPDQFLVQGDTSTLACNSRTWMFYQAKYRQYTETPLSGTVAEHLAQTADPVRISPVLRVLATHGASELLIPGAIKLSGSKPEIRDGRAGTLVFLTVLADAREAMSPAVPLAAWFEESTGLLGETTLDLTSLYNMVNDRPPRSDDEDPEEERAVGFHDSIKITSALLVHRYSQIKLDQEFGEESLGFVPPEGTERVNTFHKQDPAAAAQQGMVKNRAPDFKAVDLDDKAVSLADYKGRVVVLDFWATWCGPCVAAMPQMQSLATKFANEPVTILGVNQDRERTAGQIRTFLEAKKITLRQALDPENTIGQSYNVHAIPCVAFIDKEGKLQDVVVGYSPGHAAGFDLRIRNLLDGKPIHEGSELVEQAAADTPGEMAGGTLPAVDDPSPEAAALKPVATPASTPILDAVTREIDVDGDGTLELVTVLDRNEPPAGLGIFRSDGTIERRLPLEQAVNGTVAWFDFGLKQWSVVHQTQSSAGQNRITVVGYSEKGNRLWKYRIETASERSAQAVLAVGDLAGDGSACTAVLVNSYVVAKSGASRTTLQDPRASLLVLDSHGQALAVRRIGQSGSLVRCVGATSKEEKPSILVTADGRMLRFMFDGSKIVKSPEQK